jgi:hypothetical protein
MALLRQPWLPGKRKRRADPPVISSGAQAHSALFCEEAGYG